MIDDNSAAVSPALQSEGDVLGAVGRTIAAERDRSGLSMRALAKRAGISQPFLSQIESGASSPSLLTLYRIATALGLSPAELIPPVAPPEETVHVVRRGAGRLVRVSEAANSAHGRLLSSGANSRLVVTEYRIGRDEDMGDWFQSDGELTIYVVEGAIEVVIEGRGTWGLDAGDAINYPGGIRNRWQVTRGEHALVLMAYAGE